MRQIPKEHPSPYYWIGKRRMEWLGHVRTLGSASCVLTSKST